MRGEGLHAFKKGLVSKDKLFLNRFVCAHAQHLGKRSLLSRRTNICCCVVVVVFQKHVCRANVRP